MIFCDECKHSVEVECNEYDYRWAEEKCSLNIPQVLEDTAIGYMSKPQGGKCERFDKKE